MTSRIRLAPKHSDAGDEQKTERCQRCNAYGWYLAEHEHGEWRLHNCPDCAGSGRVSYWSEGAGE